ncbi:MAG: hypothetical protein ACPF9I_06420 [Candidatus Thalassarchaeaceae archaeon]
MIDTTRYEGHTEGPWHFCIGYDIETDTYTGLSPLKGGGDRVNGPTILSDYQFERGTLGHQADLKLIEDAPLLLREIKRLRKQLSEAEDVIQVALDHADEDDRKLFEDFLGVGA